MEVFSCRKRLDYILIWGHGLIYEEEIIRHLREHPFVNILYYVYFKPQRIKFLVDAVYSYDYAPLQHLREKTKYLEATPNRVLFIFFENLQPEEDYYGEKEFRHVESKPLKAFKESIRDIYNPLKNGKRTHDHVIHVSDNEMQTHFILKYLGFHNGIYDIEAKQNPFDAPFFIRVTNCTIKEVSLSNIIVSIAVGDRNEYSIKRTQVTETPQFKALNGEVDHYINYMKSHRGGAIRIDHDIDKYLSMANGFSYLNGINRNRLIVVKESNGAYQLIDGLHRAAILKKQNFEKIKVAVIT